MSELVPELVVGVYLHRDQPGYACLNLQEI